MRVELPGEGKGGREGGREERLIWNSNKIRFRRGRKEKKVGRIMAAEEGLLQRGRSDACKPPNPQQGGKENEPYA